jgi:hypothetical protein
VNIALTHLPDDVISLRKIIHSQAASYAEIESKNSTLERDLTALRGEYRFLEEQLRLLKASIYGRKSEKHHEEDGLQPYLFNEAEETIEAPAEILKTDAITVASHQRVTGGRRPLPEALPRVEVIHDLSEEEKACGCGAQ